MYSADHMRRTSATALAPSRAQSVSSRVLTCSTFDPSHLGSPVTDTVTLGPGLVIQNQSIGVASTAQGFQGVDGILGIGPVDLTEGTVSGNAPVPTVTDNLFAQGTIANDSIGIFYQPTTEEVRSTASSLSAEQTARSSPVLSPSPPSVSHHSMEGRL